MSCNPSNSEELKNRIENHKAVFDIRPGQTQQQTVDNLKYLMANFEKKDRQYTIKGTSFSFKQTVTGRISKKWEKFFPIQTDEQKDILNQKADIGNFMHDINEFVGNLILEKTKDFSVDEFLKNSGSLQISDFKYEEGIKQISDLYGYSLPLDQIANVFTGVHNVLKQIYNRQRGINIRTNNPTGKPYIVFEQILISPKESLGGTADLVVIYSDNTASVFDFKTKIPKKNQRDASGNFTEDFLTSISKQSYKMQVGALSKMLKQQVGVQKVITAPIHFIRVNAVWDADKKKYKKVIPKIAHGQSQDKFLQQLRPLTETTGFDDLDSFLSHVDKRIKDYEAKVLSDKERKDYYKEKIALLEKSKRDILTNHNFNTILSYGQELTKELTEDNIAKMSINELREIIDELKTLNALSHSTFEYRKQKLAEGSKTKEQIDEFKASMGELSSELSDKINSLEFELYNKKIVTLIESTIDVKMTDDSGRLLPFNDEGFFNKYFNRLSQFGNPIFKTFRAKLDSAQYDQREAVKKVIADVQENEDALYSWMKRNGKDRSWFKETFIDNTTDNLKNELKRSFVDELIKIKSEKDFEKIKQYYDPSENYLNWTKTAAEKITDPKMKEKFLKEKDLNDKNSDGWIKALYAGNLTLKESVRKKNFSSEYLYIQSVPELKNYYEMFVKWNKEFRSVLNVEYFQMPNSFLPNVRKTTMERIQDLGVIKGMGESITDMIKELDVREDDQYYGELEDGRLTRRIPRFFINPFKDSDENVIIGEKSYDLGKSLIIFSKMAYNYKYMSQIESEVLGLREFLVERGQEFIVKRGKQMEDYVGNKIAIHLKGTDTQAIFDAFVDNYLYGISVQPNLGDKSGTWEKRILKAKQYFSLKALGLGFVPAIGGFVAAKTNVIIEGNKGIMYDKTQYKEALNDMVQNRTKYLALSGFFDPMLHKFDNFSVSKQDKLGQEKFGLLSERNNVSKYVNARLLLRPFSKGDETIDELIAASMAKNYYVDDLGNLRRMATSEDKVKFKDRSIWELFSYSNDVAKLNIPEEQLKDVIISFRKAVQEGQSKIKGTMPEEDKAYWQSQIVGQVMMHFKSWMPGIFRERFGEIRYNDSIKAVDLGKYRAVGVEFSNVEKLATIDYLKEVIPQKILQFLKHLFFLGKLGKLNDVGVKRMFFEQWLDENPHYKGKISYDEFADIQQRQLKSLMVELRILLTFAALLMLMGGDWDDDGQKDYRQYFITRKLAAIMFKANQEMTFTYNPVEFAKMLANPFPMMGLLTDASKVISNGFDETKDLLIGENVKSDNTDYLYYSSKFIPGGNQLIKFLDIFNKDSGDAYN
jgi:hypothetical protein